MNRIMSNAFAVTLALMVLAAWPNPHVESCGFQAIGGEHQEAAHSGDLFRHLGTNPSFGAHSGWREEHASCQDSHIPPALTGRSQVDEDLIQQLVITGAHLSSELSPLAVNARPANQPPNGRLTLQLIKSTLIRI